jgi:hypothetical protein
MIAVAALVGLSDLNLWIAVFLQMKLKKFVHFK